MGFAAPVEGCSTWNIRRDGPGSHKGNSRLWSLAMESLAMEMEQERNSKNDRRQKDLADVKVQYLLVGGRGVAEDGFFLILCFPSSNGID